MSEPGDASEREADAVADRVLSMSSLSSSAATIHEHVAPVSRAASSAASIVPRDVPSAVHDTLRSPGQPLDVTTRDFFEPRFGRDLRDVRIHTGAQSAASARSVGASAYTVGSDIVFDTDQYAPQSTSGRRLLAHELTHVAQQSQGQPVLQRQPQKGECDPTKLSMLGTGFNMTPNEAKALALPVKYAVPSAGQGDDFVLYCPHRSSRPLKKLVGCTPVYWVAEAGARGKGKAEVWAQMDGEADYFHGFVKKSKLQDTPCERIGVTTVERPRSAGSGTTSPPSSAPACAPPPKQKFSYGHKKNCPRSFLESHIWPGTHLAARKIQHALNAFCAAMNGGPTARNKEARVQMVAVFGNDWRTKASVIYDTLHKLKNAVGDKYTFDCVGGFDDGDKPQWAKTWTRTWLTGGPGGDVKVWYENFQKRPDGDLKKFAEVLIHELGHRFVGMEHGSDGESEVCSGDTDDAYCYAVLADEMWRLVSPEYTCKATDMCLSGSSHRSMTDPSNWD